MFKKQLILATFFFLLLGYLSFRVLNIDAQMSYEKLINLNGSSHLNEAQEIKNSTKQIRYQVSKQILYKNEGERLHSCLVSAQSELSIEHSNLIEHFKELSCWIQEKSASKEGASNQSMRTFKALSGDYSYQSGQLHAQDVEVAHFLVPLKSFPESWESCEPLIKGQAKNVRISLFKHAGEA